MRSTPRPVWDGPLKHPVYSKVVKRGIDLLLSAILLVPCLLAMLPIALLVKRSSPGPVFYRAPRGGYHNKPFRIFKFRTMVVGADKGSGTTALDDPRVTRVGKVLRRAKLDELPQIFNILLGQMSFIGPRPELLKYTDNYTEGEQCILWVRPGISDPCSVKLIALDEAVGHDDPEGTYEREVLAEKNRMRVSYARSQCFTGDARCFLSTVGGVFTKVMGKRKDGQ